MDNNASNGFLALAGRRRSVRMYGAQPVARAKLERCLEAARLAPSACNSQPWFFVVVDEPALKNEIAAAAAGGILPLNHFARQAPVLVVVAVARANITACIGAAVKAKPFAMMDVAIAAEHFCLQATDEGLGTCMLGWFNEKRVRSLLAMPNHLRPVLILTVGHAADEPTPRRRKSMEEISAWHAQTMLKVR